MRGANADKVQLSFRVPRDLADHLKAMAEREDRTVSGELRRLIARHVAQDRKVA